MPDGTIVRNVPEGTTRSELERRYGLSKATPAPAAKPETYDPTEGMSWAEKAAASVGAGMTDLALGARQRYADVFGSPEDKKAIEGEVAEKRARDEQLMNATTGGKVLRVVGGAAPLAVIPGGQGAAGSIVMGALAGGAGGLLEPTLGDESAVRNAAWGAAGGAALPAALSAVNWARGAVSKFGAAGAQRAAGEDLVRQLGPEAAEATAARMTPPAAPTVPGAAPGGVPGPGGIPITAAARSGSNELAQAERVSRMRTPGPWREFDERQARAISDAVQRATAAADQLGARATARDAAFTSGWQGVEQAVNPEVFATGRAQLRAQLEQLSRSPEAMQPEVRNVLRQLANDIDELGAEFSPAHFQQVRANLAGKTNPGMAAVNPYKAAPRSARPIIALKNNIDQLLDQSSGGAWSPVVQGYREASRDVNASQAAQAVRDVFFDPQTGLARKSAADLTGEVPTITQAGLQTALERARNQRTGQTLLDTPSHEALQQTMEAIRRQQQIQLLNRSATGGGGSATAPNLMALAQDAGAGAVGKAVEHSGMPGKMLMGALNAGRAVGGARQADAAARALQDPMLMQQLLRETAARMGEPAGSARVYEVVMRALREGAASAASAVPGQALQYSQQQ